MKSAVLKKKKNQKLVVTRNLYFSVSIFLISFTDFHWAELNEMFQWQVWCWWLRNLHSAGSYYICAGWEQEGEWEAPWLYNQWVTRLVNSLCESSNRHFVAGRGLNIQEPTPKSTWPAAWPIIQFNSFNLASEPNILETAMFTEQQPAWARLGLVYSWG